MLYKVYVKINKKKCICMYNINIIIFIFSFAAPKCGDLEVFSKTGSDCRTCYNYKSIKTCVPKAEPGCYCLPEHFRDGKQKCYPLSLCEDCNRIRK